MPDPKIVSGEKPAVLMTSGYLKQEAQAGRCEDFERYLFAVPDAAPAKIIALIKRRLSDNSNA